MCHLAVKTRLLEETCIGSKIQFLENTGRIFEDKLQGGRVGMLFTKIWKTCSTNHRHKTSRLKHTRTEENVSTVDEMAGLLNNKG